MKSYCKGLAVDADFVGRAYENWRSGESGRTNEWRVYKEYGSPDALIAEIVAEANAGTLRFESLSTRPRQDGGKLRNIGIEGVKQQICGYTVDLAVDGLMRAKTGYWQVNRPGMGQFRAAPTVQKWVNQCAYHVHLDVKSCYESVMCADVMRVLEKYVRSGVVLGIAKAIMDSYPDGHLMIGSYFSLRMALLILSFGYHHVEDLHKTRRGKRVALVEHQAWYVDDIWLFGSDKRNLKCAARDLAKYLKAEFGLKLKPWKVCKATDDEPTDIAGPVVRRKRITIRDKTFCKGRRALFRCRRKPTNLMLARRLIAYCGWFKHTDSQRFCDDNGLYPARRQAKKVIARHDRFRSSHAIRA